MLFNQRCTVNSLSLLCRIVPLWGGLRPALEIGFPKSLPGLLWFFHFFPPALGFLSFSPLASIETFIFQFCPTLAKIRMSSTLGYVQTSFSSRFATNIYSFIFTWTPMSANPQICRITEGQLSNLNFS